MYKIDTKPTQLDGIDDAVEIPLDLLHPLDDLGDLLEGPGLKEIMGLDREPTFEEHMSFLKALATEVSKAAKDKKRKDTSSPSEAKSKPVTLRVPGPVLVKFKAMAKSKGRPYQTEMNRILREAVKAQGDTSIS